MKPSYPKTYYVQALSEVEDIPNVSYITPLENIQLRPDISDDILDTFCWFFFFKFYYQIPQMNSWLMLKSQALPPYPLSYSLNLLIV